MHSWLQCLCMRLRLFLCPFFNFLMCLSLRMFLGILIAYFRASFFSLYNFLCLLLILRLFCDKSCGCSFDFYRYCYITFSVALTVPCTVPVPCMGSAFFTACSLPVFMPFMLLSMWLLLSLFLSLFHAFYVPVLVAISLPVHVPVHVPVPVPVPPLEPLWLFLRLLL
jgi:hypothetical protein